MDKDIFMHIDSIGDMYIYDVLLEYIYPRVFVCEDDFECKYLFYEMDSTDDVDIWLVTKIRKNTYFELIDKKKAIQDVYKNAKRQNLMEIKKMYTDDSIEISTNAYRWLDELPNEPVYSEKMTVGDISSDTFKSARDTGKTTFDIRLFPGSDRHSVPYNVMEDICASISSMAGSIYGKRLGDRLNVSTAVGSCVIRFSFDSQINMQNEKSIESGMDILNDMLESVSLEDKLKKIKNKDSFIRNYHRLLQTIKNTGSDVQFTTAAPNSKKITSIEMTKNNVIDRYEKVRNFFEEEVSESEVEGKLIALDIRTKRFKLQQNDETIITGTVDDSVIESISFNVPGNYKAKVSITKKLDRIEYCKVVGYKIIEIVAI